MTINIALAILTATAQYDPACQPVGELQVRAIRYLLRLFDTDAEK